MGQAHESSDWYRSIYAYSNIVCRGFPDRTRGIFSCRLVSMDHHMLPPSFRSFAVCTILLSSGAAAQTGTLPASLRARIDSLANAELKSSGAPSVSIAIVKDGALAYANAYGNARVKPDVKA